MKNLKFLSMFVALICALGFTSCSESDGPDLSGKNDYYIDVTVAGGGWSASRIAEFESDLQEGLFEFSDYLEGVKSEDAIELFDEIVDDFEYEYRYGATDIDEPMYLRFDLKTQIEGAVIRSRTITIKPAK